MNDGAHVGYPMTWVRVMHRNHLEGDYDHETSVGSTSQLGMLRGDLRRLETDQRDDAHLQRYADMACCTPEQARIILNAFFAGSF